MKALRNYLDKIKPHFEKGGKFEKLSATYEVFDTLFFVQDTVTQKGAHVRDSIDLKRTMMLVVISLMPALFFGMWNTGYQHYTALNETFSFGDAILYGMMKIIPLIAVCYITGGIIEIWFAQVRGHEVNEGFFVTGLLIPLIVPADIPLWMLSLATVFAVIIGKEVFGGTGMNIANPALLARAFLFFAYPGKMSGDSVWISALPDGVSGATPLAHAAAGNIDQMPSAWDMFVGTIPGSVGETSVIAILIGALILLITGIGSWKIMFSVFAGGLFMGGLLNLFGANEYMQLPAYYHLLMGGFAFGAVFMATDPVTAANTERGKWIYGFLVGVMAILVRVLNPAYPEGMMLAILLMNVFAPLIDYYVVQANIKRRLKRAKANA